jgi:hypothetical protein
MIASMAIVIRGSNQAELNITYSCHALQDQLPLPWHLLL